MTGKNTLPPPIQDLSPQEIFIFTQIPIFKTAAFIKGQFKPNSHDREILTNFGKRITTNWASPELKRAFIDRAKYRLIQPFLSSAEKDDILLSRPEKIAYTEKLNEYVNKYWDQIVIAIAEKNAK